MAGYNEKIKAWEEQRDELKRKILEDGFDPDAQQEGETASGVDPEAVTE